MQKLTKAFHNDDPLTTVLFCHFKCHHRGRAATPTPGRHFAVFGLIIPAKYKRLLQTPRRHKPHIHRPPDQRRNAHARLSEGDPGRSPKVNNLISRMRLTCACKVGSLHYTEPDEFIAKRATIQPHKNRGQTPGGGNFADLARGFNAGS